ncbi:hypothetical protein LOK49_LG13G02323 [Camellia lanceoleosa]|uniref:Uncharacterized protein n=1 Tax=Camellia lanceoleosa TaxID=1840588 RepID=A0ACC0FK65_9ERIC|nr:hypothetical protein LOK49_LG13G02323 [Camellia lanceoleosa]
MKTHDLAFSGRPILLRQQKLSCNGLDVAFSPYNDLWREMRKIFVHLFSSKRVQSFRLIREDKVSRMVKKISQLADSSKVVNLSEVVMSLTITLICRVAFGKRLEKNFKELDLFYQDLIDDHLNPKRTEFMQEDILDILLQLRNDEFPPIDLTLDHIKAVLMEVGISSNQIYGQFQGSREKQVLMVAKAVEDKINDEIHALDHLDLDDIDVLREHRLQQMKKISEKRRRWIALGHGEYSEIPAEKNFFSVVKASDRVVCHFYRENWPCKVMDKHLSILAKQHIETRFVKIHAEKSLFLAKKNPFLAEKLKIVVLPTLALIKSAKVDDYVVGFNELGGTDEFSTKDLEERLAKAQVIFFEGESSLNPSKSSAKSKSVRQSSNSHSSDSDS